MKGFLLGFGAFCFGILAFVMLCIATVRSVYAYNVQVTWCEVTKHNDICTSWFHFGFCYRVDCLSQIEGRDVTWCSPSSSGWNCKDWPVGKKFQCSYWASDYRFGYVGTFDDWKRYWMYFTVSLAMFTMFFIQYVITEPEKLKKH